MFSQEPPLQAGQMPLKHPEEDVLVMESMIGRRRGPRNESVEYGEARVQLFFYTGGESEKVRR